MRKFAILFILPILLLTSCDLREKYTPIAGEYGLSCVIGDDEYNIDLVLNEDGSVKLTFPKNSSLCDWYFIYYPENNSIKYFTSLGEESEVSNQYVRKIFEFLLDSHESIAVVSHERISGRDVSVLETSDGTVIYTDSQSGEPLRLVYKNMTADITSRPETTQDVR